MAIFTPPPAAPQRGDRATFSGRVDAFLTWMVNLIPQLTAFFSQLTSMAGGGGFSIPYLADLSSVSDGDPGSGKFRFNQATQNTSTALYLDLFSSTGNDATGQLTQLGASTSSVKGTLRLVKQTDPSKYLVFAVTGLSTPSGYRGVAVTPVDSSEANPFAANDIVLFQFSRTGDKGDIGTVAPMPTMYVREEQPAGTGSTTPNSVAAWITCVLNTTKVNEISGASLSANQIVLPAGTYEFEGSSPAATNNVHKAQLYNLTDGVSIDSGSTESSNATTITTRSILRGKFTISSSKTVSIRRYVSGSVTSVAYTNPGIVEVYAEIKFKKVA